MKSKARVETRLCERNENTFTLSNSYYMQYTYLKKGCFNDACFIESSASCLTAVGSDEQAFDPGGAV